MTNCNEELIKTKRSSGKARWTKDCSRARDRNRLFFHIWKSVGCPKEGATYECYRDSKRSYRKVCRQAVQNGYRRKFNLIDKLHKEKKPSSMWNIIRQSKGNQMNQNSIDMNDLVCYYKTKFEAAPPNDFQNEAAKMVADKYDTMEHIYDNKINISLYKVKKYIKQLRLGCSPGAMDGIMAEHLAYGINTDVPLILSRLLTVCLRHGLVPDAFFRGTLIPILKKPNLDPTVAKNYRPITVSTTVSKILECHIIEECESHVFSPYQFGFIPQRNTTMAAALAHDVAAHSVASGSPIYFCSLDAEGAYDALPHSVIFQRANGVMPDQCWRLMYYWYNHMYINVKWKNNLSVNIPVKRGTRQGGLTSSLLFNLFYQDLINELSNCNSGIILGSRKYNVYCYADDLLLSSTTPTGLQNLINIANGNICKNGLRFNPNKTECFIAGKHPFTSTPQWFINDTRLKVVDKLTYLGTTIGDMKGHEQANMRIRAGNKAYYSLQGAGLNAYGVTPQTALHIYNTAVRTCLTYGCAAINISPKYLKEIDITQGKHIKSLLGLNYHARTTPLLEAVQIQSISKTIESMTLDLFKTCWLSDSATKQFYGYLLNSYKNCDNRYIHNTLFQRCLSVCERHDINLFKYVFNPTCAKYCKQKLKAKVQNGNNGLIDSIRNCLDHYNADNRTVLKLLLRSY